MPTGLNSLKSKVDKLDVDKLVPVPVDLSKRSDVVKMMLLKKMYRIPRIKDIENKIPDITNLTTNTTLNAKIIGVKNKILSITNMATAAAPYAKINEVKNKTPNITNLATNATLTAVENRIPDHKLLLRIKCLTIVNISLLQNLIS